MMTDLSPATYAVLEAAYWAPDDQNATRAAVAAALRAVAAHCLPQTIRDRRWIRVEDILAIAAELEGTND
jgi:hypothetical protein